MTHAIARVGFFVAVVAADVEVLPGGTSPPAAPARPLLGLVPGSSLEEAGEPACLDTTRVCIATKPEGGQVN